MKVLNFGSLNIDYVYTVDSFVVEGETKASSRMESFAGGKGLNQSVALRKAGIPTYHAGNCGSSGKFLLKTLKQYDINTQHVITSDVNTGHAVIQVDKNGENCILLFAGSNDCVSKEHIDSVLENFTSMDILLLQNEISNIPYLIEEGVKRGIRIFFNPTPIDVEILNLNLEGVDTLILNEQELLCFASQKNASVNQALAELCERYPTINILITLGIEGGIYKQCDESTVHYHSYETDVVDSTAAGDTFIGFFIAGLLKEEPMSHVLNFAAMASTLCVSKKGAAVSIPSNQEVLESFKSATPAS